MPLPISSVQQLESLTEEAFEKDLGLQELLKVFKSSLEAQNCSDKTLELFNRISKLSYTGGAIYGAELAVEILTTRFHDKKIQE